MCAGFGALAARFATSRARRVRARSGRKEASISTFLRLSNGFMDIHGRTGYVRCISPLARARRSGRGDVGTRRGLTRRGLECLCRVARRPAPIDNTAAHARCRCRSENTNSGARLRRCPSASRRGHGSCPVRCGPSFWPCIGADAGRAALLRSRLLALLGWLRLGRRAPMMVGAVLPVGCVVLEMQLVLGLGVRVGVGVWIGL